MPTPATSAAPNSRTIGTGDSHSTRNPAAVASAATPIAGAARRAAARALPSSCTRAWYCTA